LDTAGGWGVVWAWRPPPWFSARRGQGFALDRTAGFALDRTAGFALDRT
jgi:hypothetical protein